MAAVRSIFKSQFHVIGKYIYKLPHNNENGVSLVRLKRRELIKETPKSGREKTVYFVVGECSLVQNIHEALEEGYKVEVITGPKLRDSRSQNGLINLLKKHPNDLEVSVSEKRPENHSALINGTIVRESFHLNAEPYEYAKEIKARCTTEVMV